MTALNEEVIKAIMEHGDVRIYLSPDGKGIGYNREGYPIQVGNPNPNDLIDLIRHNEADCVSDRAI